MLRHKKNNCNKTCIVCHHGISITHETQFSLCDDPKENRCFWEASKLAKDKPILAKPCTKLQFKVPKELESTYSFDSTKAAFEFMFSKPAHVTGKEEYLIYDLVSMVSAIGGTMGVCIGLTYGFLTRIFAGFEKIKVFIQKLRQNNLRRMPFFDKR